MLTEHRDVLWDFIAFTAHKKLFKRSRVTLDSVAKMIEAFERSEFFKCKPVDDNAAQQSDDDRFREACHILADLAENYSELYGLIAFIRTFREVKREKFNERRARKVINLNSNKAD